MILSQQRFSYEGQDNSVWARTGYRVEPLDKFGTLVRYHSRRLGN